MYDLGFKIFQWFTVYPRFKVYNLGFGVQNLGYRIQYFANILTIFIYLFFVTIFMYFYYFILKIYIIFRNSILFPFLKDIKYQILNHYWLVNLQVHLGGEPKNFSFCYVSYITDHINYALYVRCPLLFSDLHIYMSLFGLLTLLL